MAPELPHVGVTPAGRALVEVFTVTVPVDPSVLAERVGGCVAAGDVHLAARASAAARSVVRDLAGSPVPDAGVALHLGGAAVLLVAAAAVCVGVQPGPGRASLGDGGELWGSGRPPDAPLVAACGLLAAAVPPAARTVAAQLHGTGTDVDRLPREVGPAGGTAPGPVAGRGGRPGAGVVQVSAHTVADVVRRAALVCANTEPTWATVAACGWLVGVSSTIAGVPADPAGCAFELRASFDAAAAAGDPRRAGVPLERRTVTGRSGARRVPWSRGRRAAPDAGLERPQPPRT